MQRLALDARRACALRLRSRLSASPGRQDLQTRAKVAVKTRNTLSMVYTPGVARVCRAIAEDKKKAFAFTCRANSVAVVSDGTAILGLGDLGPEAAMPVMEGKIMLFKEFADIDGWPLCLGDARTWTKSFVL